MVKMRIVAVLCVGASLLMAASLTALTRRVGINQRGGFVIVGNTLGHDCLGSIPAPVVGTVGTCGNSTSDSAIDILWRADSPAPGQAEALTTISVAEARSTAVLAFPAGVTVTHAFLYWGGTLTSGPDVQVLIERPGGFSTTVTAAASFVGANNYYVSVGDVTSTVQTAGEGAYRLSGVAVNNPVDLNNSM